MAPRTASAARRLTPGVPLMTRDTVDLDTPATAATSSRVTDTGPVIADGLLGALPVVNGILPRALDPLAATALPSCLGALPTTEHAASMVWVPPAGAPSSRAERMEAPLMRLPVRRLPVGPLPVRPTPHWRWVVAAVAVSTAAALSFALPSGAAGTQAVTPAA